jgi:hypothetical protein
LFLDFSRRRDRQCRATFAQRVDDAHWADLPGAVVVVAAGPTYANNLFEEGNAAARVGQCADALRLGRISADAWKLIDGPRARLQRLGPCTFAFSGGDN